MIAIETSRYSEVIKAFIEKFPSAEAKLDGERPTGEPASWCTNARLKATIEFSLVDQGKEILGFRNGPWNMTAADEALPLLQALAEMKILQLGPRKISWGNQSIYIQLIILNVIIFIILYSKFGFNTNSSLVLLLWTLWLVIP